MRNARNSSLMAAAAIAMSGAVSVSSGWQSPTSRSRGRHFATKRDTALDREIAAHNAEVERRKAEKKAKRAAKTKELGS